ncbi:MAG: hypothetical protein FD140_4497 [Limisphaerales bacterium]|nr:MAG: hypothetical protein FD140_4497 [Limisphaerales bacterium]
MGDRCYMQVTCRREDIPEFEALGFHVEFEQSQDSPIVELIDEEANYAHADLLPTDIPFTATHGAGGNYGDGKIACDGNHYAEVSANQDGFVVSWDEASNQPAQESLARIRDYLAVHQTVQEMFQTLSARPIQAVHA